MNKKNEKQRDAKYALAERLREGLNHSDRRRNISRDVINDMKRNFDHRPLRGTVGLAATNDDPLGAEHEGPLGIRDGSSSMEQILEGLPDFEKNQLMRGGNAGSHVRISQGNIIPNQPIIIGSESNDE